jgi:hypothetical protein
LREADQGLDIGKMERGLNECRYSQCEEKRKEADGEVHDARNAWGEADGP